MLNNVRVRKPFHEAITDVIRVALDKELEVIGYLLTTAIIPRGHEEIVTALKKRCAELCWDPNTIAYLEESILSHKREQEEAKKDGGDAIKVKVSLKGQTYEGNLDPEESFVAVLMAVQRQGNNKIVEALGYLAEIGDQHHMDSEHAISRKNRLGF